MRLLLDTNALLWYFWGSPRIDAAKELIQSTDSQVFISAVSWWEIAIKARIGKLPVEVRTLRAFAGEYAFEELPLYGRAVEALNSLPAIHNDPFDHMLLAQALSEPMRFITGDALLADYSSLVIVI
jgi:PIN domain nuclease of toxin-antitoxin system